MRWLAWCLLVVCCVACQKPTATDPKPVEEPFAKQVAAVKSHERDEIRLLHSAVDSKELQQLLNLGSLRTLVLDRGVVTDKDIPLLADLKSLTHLRMRLSPLTDVGIQDLAKLRLVELQILNLPQSKLTAAGLKELAGLPKLKQVRLGGRQIDDAAVLELSHWPALESVHLINPGITDVALETFAAMPELSTLYVDGAQVSNEAWDKLQTARPKLHLHLDQVHDDLQP